MTGIIIKAMGRYYTVRSGDLNINCTLRGRIKKDKRLEKFSEPVAVGDIVDFEMSDEFSGSIETIHKRKNAFSRKDKFEGKEDIIAANCDLVAVIMSFSSPRLNFRFADRVLVRSVKEGIPALVCVNKSDLAADKEIRSAMDYYRNTGVEVLVMSAKNGSGIAEFEKVIAGQTVLFIGYSGAGKTTILNKLDPGLNARTTETSRSTGKGKHTTTNVEMYFQADGMRIIDTPGLREFGLLDIEPASLSDYFREFSEFAGRCGFTPCTHDHEPDCEIRRQVENGSVSGERYISYLNIFHSLSEEYKNRYR